MWLIVGLRNPEEYDGSRHNIGGEVVKYFAEQEGLTFRENKKAGAFITNAFTVFDSANSVSAGDVSAGDVSAGNVSAGHVSVGNVSAGNASAGDLFAGDLFAGDASTSNASASNASAVSGSNDIWNSEPHNSFGNTNSSGNSVSSAFRDKDVYDIPPAQNNLKKDSASDKKISRPIKAVCAMSNGYMNLSGEPVKKLLDYYKATPDNLIVVHDDIELDFGKIKVRKGGSEAGHNGLRSVTKLLRTRDYTRIRFGVGRPENKNYPIDKYVLSKFTPTERRELPDLLFEACDKICSVLRESAL